MHSFFAKKTWIILLAVLAVAALLGLAIGLRKVPLRAGQAFGQNEARMITIAPLQMIKSVPFQMQLSVWVLLVLMAVLIGTLMSPEGRRRLIRFLIRAAFIYWTFYLLTKRYPDLLSQLGLHLNFANNAPASVSKNPPLPVFVPPQTVSWVSYLVSFGIAVLLIVLVWRMYSTWQKIDSDSSLQKKLAGIARSSLSDLSSGRNSSDVIMNCYFRMSDVVSDKKNIDRNKSTTPTEFASRLEQAGLPAEAVRKLTALFESVRYGGYQSDAKSVNEAVACLTTILHHCGETV